MRTAIYQNRSLSRAVTYLTIALLFTTSITIAHAEINQTAEQAKPARSEDNQSSALRLEAGKAIERELKGGEAHTYEISLQAGQYLDAVVEQRGIDVVVAVVAPDGKQLLEVDSPNGTQGPEPVTLIAEASGSYKLNVRSLEKDAPVGRYEIKVSELRAATERDIELAKASKLYKEAQNLFATGKFDAAIPLCERVIEIREKFLGPDHHDVAQSVNYLALQYKRKGEYEKAEPLYQRALAIYEKALGPEHRNVGTVLNNLAELHRDKGEYVKAEALHRRGLSIREKALGPYDIDVAQSLNNLALLYNDRSEYAKAEPLYRRSLAIWEKALGPVHSEVATSLNNLATLYQNRGDYAKAEPLFQRSLSIYEKTLVPGHPDIARGLNNLAVLYALQGDYTKAEPLAQRSLRIAEKALVPYHPYIALSLNIVADIYMNKGEHVKAEPLLQRSLSIFEKTLGPEHRNVAMSLNNLASLYAELGEHAKAESFAQRSLAIFEKALGHYHPNVALTLNNLASQYTTQNNPASALTLRTRAVAVTDRNISSNISTGSERQKLAYLSLTSLETNAVISLNTMSLPKSVEATRLALSAIVSRKGRALDAMTDSIATLRRRASPEDRDLIDQLADARTQLASLSLKGPGREGPEKYKQNFTALQEKVEQLESQISLRSAEFRAQLKPITLDAVQNAIPADVVLVEFFAYRQYNPKATTREGRYGQPRYIAYVLGKRGGPVFVELGEAKIIDRKIDELRKALRDKRRGDVRRLARRVDEQVMQPVRKLIGMTRHVFISPDGALNLIPFAALVDERGEYLVKRYLFTYLTSGRDLLRLQEKIPGNKRAMIVADPDFGDKTDIASSPSEANQSEYADLYFNRLPATEQEARQLRRILPEAQTLTRGNATESALKSTQNPRILHIATHGFFLDDLAQVQPGDEKEQTRIIKIKRAQKKVSDENDPATLVNPLLRSGLGLSGANTRSGKDGNDGILTALEASGLDLWGTKLVVLSACDTGVGEVRSGEGVYGLRRALVLAGSESQMMSLWPVSDRGTRDLMIEYYKMLKAGRGRSEALRQVQIRMLREPKRRHPFYWASFIQSGEWANLNGKR